MTLTLEQLQDSIPGYGKDLKPNLSAALRQSELTPRQTWGAAVASAFASRNPSLYEAIFAEAAKNVGPEILEAAKSAAAIAGMNNIYYRFQHLVEHDEYSSIPTHLRMNVTRTHGVDRTDFELWSLAVSAVNGCGKCIVAHERRAREKGISKEAIVAVVRIASVIYALAVLFDIERVGVSAPA